MSAHARDFDATNYICFNKRWWIIEKFNEIWVKVKNSVKNEFFSEPLYNGKYLKAKMKSYDLKINIYFNNNIISRDGSEFICLSVILIDSAFRACKNYHPQVFSEE